MKPVKNYLSAMALALILAASIFAGDLHGPGIVTPQPTPSPESLIAQDETMPVCDPNTGCLSTETSDSLFYEALAALLSVY